MPSALAARRGWLLQTGVICCCACSACEPSAVVNPPSTYRLKLPPQPPLRRSREDLSSRSKELLVVHLLALSYQHLPPLILSPTSLSSLPPPICLHGQELVRQRLFPAIFLLCPPSLTTSRSSCAVGKTKLLRSEAHSSHALPPTEIV